MKRTHAANQALRRKMHIEFESTMLLLLLFLQENK